MTPANCIAAAISETCNVDPSLPYRPSSLASRIAFVEPAEPWKERDGSFCGVSVGLVAWLVIGTTDPVAAQEWLDDQSTRMMQRDAIDIGADVIGVSSVDPPLQLVQDNGASFLACRIKFDRFTIGAS